MPKEQKKSVKKVAKKAGKKTAKKAPAKKAPAKKEEAVKPALSNQPPLDIGFNEHGLRKNETYEFLQNGFVDWKKKVDESHCVVNEKWFIERGKDIPSKVTEDLEDDQMIIKLSGYRDLANIRGFKGLKMVVEESNSEFACVRCKIVWRGNYETNFEDVVFEAVANATRSNTDVYMNMFLETIAANRAFCRCVRNFLNISIVSSDELSHGKQKRDLEDEKVSSLAEDAQESDHSHITPQKALKRSYQKGYNSGDFNDLIEFLRGAYANGDFRDNTNPDSVAELKGWADWDSVPSADCMDIIKLIKDSNG